MKKLVLLLVAVLALTSFAACGSSELKAADVARLAEIGFPVELVPSGVKFDVDNTAIIYNMKKMKFDELKTFYTAALDGLGATMTADYGADELVAMGLGNAEMVAAGYQSWLYNGTYTNEAGEKRVIFINMNESEIEISRFTSVVVSVDAEQENPEEDPNAIIGAGFDEEGNILTQEELDAMTASGEDGAVIIGGESSIPEGEATIEGTEPSGTEAPAPEESVTQ